LVCIEDFKDLTRGHREKLEGTETTSFRLAEFMSVRRGWECILARLENSGGRIAGGGVTALALS
jgi:hypothetical protein